MTQLLHPARVAVANRLAALERSLLVPPGRLQQRPLFVISVPRSGSTLLYLLLLQRFRMAYFSNLMAAFPDSPVTIARMTRWLGGLNPPNDLHSVYGATRGWRGPNQGWRVWNRWLPESQDYIDPDALDARSLGEMRATVDQLQRRLHAPFASKWQRHAPRLRALAAGFPEALFVYLRRSPELTAQSILAGRRQFLGDESAWFSARPRDFERIRQLDPLEQVCEQVVSLERDIRQDIDLIGTERFTFMSYEGLCLAPQAALDGIAEWYLERTGQPLRARRELDVSLDAQASPKVPAAEFEQIRQVLQRLYGAESRARLPA